MKNIQKNSPHAAFIRLLGISVFFIGTQAINAKAVPPTIRIVLPQRFRVLTDQFFVLRIEAENLGSSRVFPQITVFDENGKQESINYAGQYEVSSDNDNNPNNIDRAFTYRKMSFTKPGIKTIQAVIVDGNS